MPYKDKKKKMKNDIAWKKKSTVLIGLRFSKEKDSEILNFLSTKQSRLNYIRDLIRQDMKKEKEGEA